MKMWQNPYRKLKKVSLSPVWIIVIHEIIIRKQCLCLTLIVIKVSGWKKNFTSCILFTSVTSEQNTMSKGHLALKKATISCEYDVHRIFFMLWACIKSELQRNLGVGKTMWNKNYPFTDIWSTHRYLIHSQFHSQKLQ